MIKKLVLIFLLSLSFISSVLSARVIIKDIKFQNLHSISKDIALDTLTFDINDVLSESEINEAIKSFYKFEYFDDIQVKELNGVLTFEFKEKPSIIEIEIKNYKNSADDQKELLNKIAIKKGDLLKIDKLENVKKFLLKNLEDEGLIDSIVEYEIKYNTDTTVKIIFDVQKGKEILINKLTYNGLNKLKKSDLEKFTVNKEAQSFGWFFGRNSGELKLGELNNDAQRIKDIYMRNGYLDAKIDSPLLEVDFNNYKSTLIFNIEENDRYFIDKIKIDINNKDFNIKNLKNLLAIKSGEVFNIENLRKDIRVLKTTISNKGYAFARIFPDFIPNKETKKVDVVYRIFEGDKVYINNVIISGNKRTIDRVIRREIFLAPGDLFNYTDFIDSKKALQRTGYFDKIDIQQKRVSDDKIDLMVKVIEAATGNIMVGGGYGSYDGILLNASINDKNIFGSGIDFGLGIDNSSRQSKYYISLYSPRIKDSKYTGSLDLHNNEYDTYYDTYQFRQKSVGIGIGIGKKYNRYTNLFLKYRFDNISEVYEEYDSESGEYIIKPEKDESYKISSLTPSISFNNTDDFYVPRNGIIASTSLEFAGIGGDSKFARSINSFKYFYGFKDKIDYDLIFRYKAKLNIIADMGKITKGNSFYLGGVSSVRGYEAYAFGPDTIDDNPFKKFFTNSLELSIPLIESAKMRLAFFIDYGMIGENSFTEYNKAGAGTAIEWFSPVGPVSFIFAKAINPEDGDRTSNFEFNLGQRF